MAVVPSAAGAGLYDVTDDETGAPLLTEVPEAYLYSSLVPPPAAGPDARTAQAPKVSDYGLQLTGVPSMADVGQAPPAQQQQPQFTPVGPVQPQRAAPQPAPPAPDLAGPDDDASAAPAQVPQSNLLSNIPQQQEGTDPAAAALAQQYLLSGAQGTPGVRVRRPERDVPTTFQVKEGTAPLSEEAERELRRAELAQQAVASGAGERFGEYALASAEAYSVQRVRAEENLAALRQRTAEEQRHVADRMTALDSRIEALRAAKDDATGERKYWEDRGVVGSLLSTAALVIGAYTSTLLGGPNRIQEQVNTEIEREIQRQRNAVADAESDVMAERGALAEMRANFLSPEAAEQATRSLMLEQAAAEIAEVGAYFEGAQSQEKAKAIVAALQAQAAQRRANAELAEQDEIVRNFRHDPAIDAVIGGTQGGMAGIIAYGNKLGLKPMEAVQLALSGKLPGAGAELDSKPAAVKARLALTQDERGRRVRLADGTMVWAATDKIAEKSQAAIIASEELRDNMSRQKEILKEASLGEQVLGKRYDALISEYDALVAINKPLTRDLHDLGALTEADMTLVEPIVGAGGTDVFQSTDAARRRLETADSHIRRREGRVLSKLYSDPEANAPLSPPVATTPRK